MRALLREALQKPARWAFPPAAPTTTAPRAARRPRLPKPEAELTGWAGAFEGLGHGVVQMVSDFDLLRARALRRRVRPGRSAGAGQRPPLSHDLAAARPGGRAVEGDPGAGGGGRGEGPAAVPAGGGARHRRHQRAGRQLPPVHGLSGLQGGGPPAAGRTRRGAARAGAQGAHPGREERAPGRRRHAGAAAGGHPAGAHRADQRPHVPAHRCRARLRARTCSASFWPRRAQGAAAPRWRRCTTTFAPGDGAQPRLLPDLQLQRRQPRRGAPDAVAPARAVGPERRRRPRGHGV
jgi:hypothetical protein